MKMMQSVSSRVGSIGHLGARHPGSRQQRESPPDRPTWRYVSGGVRCARWSPAFATRSLRVPHLRPLCLLACLLVPDPSQLVPSHPSHPWRKAGEEGGSDLRHVSGDTGQLPRSAGCKWPSAIAWGGGEGGSECGGGSSSSSSDGALTQHRLPF